MAYANKEGFYLNGKFIGGNPPEAGRALNADTRRKLVQEYIQTAWSIGDVARWISDGRKMPGAEEIVMFGLDYIKDNHGYGGSGRPLAGIEYRVVCLSENKKPVKRSGKTGGKKQARGHRCRISDHYGQGSVPWPKLSTRTIPTGSRTASGSWPSTTTAKRPSTCS